MPQVKDCKACDALVKTRGIGLKSDDVRDMIEM